MKIFNVKSIALFFIITVFSTVSAAIDWFESDDESIIWRGAPNHYLKYVKQDTSKFGKNNHPIKIEEKELINALRVLEYTDESFFQGEKRYSIFSYSQVKLLAEYLSVGLSKAEPEQDIIFVIGGKNSKLLILTGRNFVAGRVFYKEGKLNIILGEFDLQRNEAFEKVLDPGDTGEIAYNFNFGSRTSQSNNFDYSIIGIPGVTQNTVKKKLRQDWIEIDVQIAAEAFLAEKEARESPGLVQEQALKLEAAKLAKQRREMRAEMARLRKEMNERNSSSQTQTIEQRITTLNDLLEKELITQEEYATRKKEILNDI